MAGWIIYHRLPSNWNGYIWPYPLAHKPTDPFGGIKQHVDATNGYPYPYEKREPDSY